MAENNVKKLLRSLCLPFQSIEDALQQLESERSVDTSIGAQLNTIGNIVGEEREGEGDDDYRRRIRGRIAVNRSKAGIGDIIRVTQLVLADFPTAEIVVHHMGEGDLEVRIDAVAIPDDVADVLIKFLRLSVAAGIRIILESSTQAPSTWFTWDVDGVGWDQGKFINARDHVQG